MTGHTVLPDGTYTVNFLCSAGSSEACAGLRSVESLIQGQRDWTFGVRYEVLPSVAISASYSYIYDIENYGLFSGDVEPSTSDSIEDIGDAEVYALTIDAMF